MAGYLSESDFVVVEEGFSTRDLLEELTQEASQATKVRGWEWGWVSVPCAGPAACSERAPRTLSLSRTWYSVLAVCKRRLILSQILGACVP